MALVYEKIVLEDLNIGTGFINVTNPSGGILQGTKVNLANISSVPLIISSSDAFTGYAGSALTGAPRLRLGTGIFTEDDAAINVHRELTGDSLFSHAFRDESTFNTINDGAYNSYDSFFRVSGNTAYNHFRSFQSRPDFSGSNTVGEINGYGWTPAINSGTVTNLYGLHISDYTGAGTVLMHAGLYIESLTRANSNYSIFSAGVNPMYHEGKIQTGGEVQVGGDVNVTGSISAANLFTLNALNVVGLGYNTPRTSTQNSSSVFVGHNAGWSQNGGNSNVMVGANAGALTTTQNRNTLVGTLAGYSQQGSNNVAIGFSAGQYETSGNRLFIDGIDRVDNVQGRVESLIYGIFDVATANQILNINGQLSVLECGEHADNAAAVTAGHKIGDIYRTGDTLKIVHA
jgi:hypothetical protein